MPGLMLVSPTLADARKIEECRAEFSTGWTRVNYDPDRIPGLDGLESHESVADWLRYCESMRGKVSWFMTVRESDGRMVGFLCLRHRLEYDDDDPEFRSHICYSIRPSERGKGYAKEQLRLGLKKAKEIGLKKVRLICLDTNAGSQKTILANGGIYVDTLHGEESGLNVLRYDMLL